MNLTMQYAGKFIGKIFIPIAKHINAPVDIPTNRYDNFADDFTGILNRQFHTLPKA